MLVCMFKKTHVDAFVVCVIYYSQRFDGARDYQFQTNDEIHVEPKEVHTRRRAEATIMPLAIGMG